MYFSKFVQILVSRLFRSGLRLYPSDVKCELTDEMQTVFALRIQEAEHRGTRVLIKTAFQELRDLPVAIILAYYDTIRGRMKIIFPTTTDQTPRLTALLSLIPLIIAGPVRIIISYQPGWQPGEASFNYLWFLLVSFLLVLAGLVLGIIKKFPRWSYPFTFNLSFAFYLFIIYANFMFHWNFRLVNSFFLYILITMALFWLPPLRTFYRQASGDWTVMTYGLFALVLFLLSEVDFSETPQLNLLVLLPSLITLAAAYAHMRIPSVFLRTAILVAALYAGLLLWLFPVFTSMVTVWIGVGIGLLMMLAYGISLTLILLSPLLVLKGIHFWQTNKASQVS